MQWPSAFNNIVFYVVYCMLKVGLTAVCSMWRCDGNHSGALDYAGHTAALLHTCTYCCIEETIWNPGLRKNMKEHERTRKSRYISISNMYFLFQLLAKKDNASQAAVHLYVVPDIWQCTSKGKIVWTWKAKSSSYPPCIHVPQSISKSKPQKGPCRAQIGTWWKLQRAKPHETHPVAICSPPKACGLDDMAMDQGQPGERQLSA